jgi:predicted anti-sigma-YlaC factor YlaD
MSEPQMRSPSFQVVAKVGISACPGVAELIDYALGRAAVADRQRIEAHLQAAGCKHCRSWIDQAAGLRGSPKSKAAAPQPLASPSLTDSTPLPDNPQWQRQAFDELERRLRLVEENE